MNSFKIGDTEFGIGDVHLSIKDGLIDLEITADEDIFDELTEMMIVNGTGLYIPLRFIFEMYPMMVKT